MIETDLEDEGDPNYKGLNGLTEEEKKERIKWLWRSCYSKAKSSATILSSFKKLNNRILKYGTKRGIVKDKEHEFKPYWFIISPKNLFIKIWQSVLMILNLYTATYAPYRMAFIDEVSTSFFFFEIFIDLLFMMDL